MTLFVGEGGLRLAVTTGGPVDGLPVILSHGAGQTRHAWGAAVAALSAEGFRAYALDLRGHGESAWSEQGGYALDDYVADLRAVIAEIGRPPILVGASMGGLVSAFYAGEPPFPPIAGLVLVDVSPNMRREGMAGIGAFMQSTRDGFDRVDDAIEAIVRYLPHRRRPPDRSGMTKVLRLAADGRYYWHWDPRTIDQHHDPDAISRRLERAAGHISAPALLLRGAESELVDGDTAHAFMDLFERGMAIDIPGARHMVAGDRNDAFGDRLLAFAQGVRDAVG